MSAPPLHLPTPAQDLAAFLNGTPGLPSHIRKRDGRLMPFTATRITRALAKAGAATGEFDDAMAYRLTVRVVNLLLCTVADTVPSVEQVQDMVEEVLLGSPFRNTARALIVYRDQHKRLREITARQDVAFIDGYLNQVDWQVRENSNMSYSLQGLNNYLSAAASQTYWLNAIYPPEIRAAHEGGDFHIHDLNQLSVYCVGWDLHDLLVQGFCGVPGKVESQPRQAPAHRSRPDRQLLLHPSRRSRRRAGVLQLRHPARALHPLRRPRLRPGQAGPAGVRLQHQRPNPRRLPDAVHQPHPRPRAARATWPTSLSIVGGELQPITYGEFQQEMNMFNRAFFEVMAEGDARAACFTFPIPTYQPHARLRLGQPESRRSLGDDRPATAFRTSPTSSTPT